MFLLLRSSDDELDGYRIIKINITATLQLLINHKFWWY